MGHYTRADGNLAVQNAAQIASGFVMTAVLLARQYDAVVANPPYMGGKYLNKQLKHFATLHYDEAKADLFAMFIVRGFEFARRQCGFNAMVTMQSWMFLSSYTAMRASILATETIHSLIHMANGVMGIAFGTSATVWHRSPIRGFIGHFRRCELCQIGSDNRPRHFPFEANSFVPMRQDEFGKVPGTPIAYWASKRILDIFDASIPLADIASPRQGMATGNNDRFVRYWHEVNVRAIRFDGHSADDVWKSGASWVPYNKGGSYRKWYGNAECILRFDRAAYAILKSQGNHCPSEHLYFRPMATWSKVTSGDFSLRLLPRGYVFDVAGCSIFHDDSKVLLSILGALNSSVMTATVSALSPTVNYEVGHIKSFPILRQPFCCDPSHLGTIESLVAMAKTDWDSSETSWEFQRLPLVQMAQTTQQSFDRWRQECVERRNDTVSMEEENNRLFIRMYGLDDELMPDANEQQSTSYSHERGEGTDYLLSYAIGCMMGRYSLDKPGLIYANSGNEGFDPSQYKTFPADPDGIIPVTEVDWFDDDAAHRFEEFVGVAWPKEHLDENLRFVAKSLGAKSGEEPRETIRRYFANEFYKHHLQTYKKRPIYWLFTSGKLGAFQCLVCLHRYNEGTLSRMRTEYVIPLQGKINARIEQLAGDAAKATSAVHRRRVEKEQELLRKHQTELVKFDEKLRHYADLRIKLDLDDGVKVNYGKFGNLLAEVKAVTGKTEE
jgi:hypothetical protein